MNYNMLNILSKEYDKNPYNFIKSLDRTQNLINDSSLNARVVICYKTAKEILSKHDIFTTEPLTERAEPVMRGKVLAQMSGGEHKQKNQ